MTREMFGDLLIYHANLAADMNPDLNDCFLFNVVVDVPKCEIDLQGLFFMRLCNLFAKLSTRRQASS